jgi:hypothetical protein
MQNNKEHICRKCVVYEIHVSSLVNLLFNVVVACFETDVYKYCSYLLYINYIILYLLKVSMVKRLHVLK